MRREWREAASSLGGNAFHYWRYVGLPVLMPSLLSAIVLLFGNSFSAYATAYALTGGGVGLVPIDIGYFLSGNVLAICRQALAVDKVASLAKLRKNDRSAFHDKSRPTERFCPIFKSWSFPLVGCCSAPCGMFQ